MVLIGLWETPNDPILPRRLSSSKHTEPQNILTGRSDIPGDRLPNGNLNGPVGHEVLLKKISSWTH
jgi:hypothetical protein